MRYAKLIGFTLGIVAAVAATRRKAPPPELAPTLTRGGSSDEQPEGEHGVDYLYKPADIGDIIAIGGYEGRTFQVDGYHITTHFLPDEYYMELFYDAIDVESDAWVEADSEDVRLIAPATEAAVYLNDNTDGDYTLNEEVTPMFFGYDANKKQEPTPTARELSAKAAAERKAAEKQRKSAIDALLDEMNDLKRLAAEFGDSDGVYEAKLGTVRKELARLSKKTEGVSE